MESLEANPLIEYQPDVLEALRKLYNLENGRMDESIDILDNWAKKQNHFKNKDFDRCYLERCILACKGSVEKAKLQLEKICTFRTILPNYFTYSNVREQAEKIEGVICVNIMPKMTKDYKRIYVASFPKAEFTSEHFMEFYRVNILIAEYMKRYDYVNGFIFIEDLRRISISDVLSKISLIDLQKYLMILMEGFGARLAAIHFLSTSKLIQSLVKVVKTMLSEKLGNRVYAHDNTDELLAEIGAEYLPKDLGGNCSTTTELHEKLVNCLSSEENERYLNKMKTFCTDESLRQGDNMYIGLSGSFRTLTVD